MQVMPFVTRKKCLSHNNEYLKQSTFHSTFSVYRLTHKEHFLTGDKNQSSVFATDSRYEKFYWTRLLILSHAVCLQKAFFVETKRESISSHTKVNVETQRLLLMESLKQKCVWKQTIVDTCRLGSVQFSSFHSSLIIGKVEEKSHSIEYKTNTPQKCQVTQRGHSHWMT